MTMAASLGIDITPDVAPPAFVDAGAITAAPDAPVIVAGAGPVGVRIAQELSRKGKRVVIFNAERWKPYNRVKLTPLLAGDSQLGQVNLPERFPGPGRVDRYDGVSIVDVDRENHRILTSTGRTMDYSKLVLALGSRAFIPGIPGKDLTGVYAFRNLSDTEALIARSMSARKVIVIGGGLLGLEAARGMSRRGAHVTVVEHESRLMPRQLDEAGGAALKARIEALGVTVRTGERIKSIDGTARVEGVTLGDDSSLAADTVIVCTGVRANTQLPSAIGLHFNRGVMVDDEMRTSDPDIYAVGECAEHAGMVYGLVGPGFDQAIAAAASITGQPVPYEGSVLATKLKILGVDVFSIGDFESIAQQPGVGSHVFADAEQGLYRRLFVDRGRIVAALGVGDWPEATRLQQAVTRRARIGFLTLRSFSRTGRLWREAEDGPGAWPREAIVCNCTGVTKGAILDAVTMGATTLDEVRSATSANSVCGTCTMHVQDLLGAGDARPEPVRWWKWLVGLSSAAGIMALASWTLPRIALPEHFVIGELLTKLWFDTIFKQWSGYILLGLTAAAAILGLRKRIRLFSKLGGYNGWRLVHLAIGLSAAGVLVWHTGFRLGSNLNFWLMASFLTALLFGALAGLVTGGEHELRERDLVGSKSAPQKLPTWIHILALWPLPVLILAHILAVYSY
ncbi:Nitrite reductase [NAD(P)H] [Hartmannibacter diazotrophicus]|uniref:Nitrite reductase [NAD(P)H] n=1 Tax=Hartmannibacter diazotrophicus TaxID=1482074 RepID=A0A2C9D3M9_9HYPH|nr:FAD-dependent oxidoreductase [Hartmannibacter diazotrophicus]SON54789.1 Nitrite reductase [NAD(P)H] [Hartmannibacter diazotrophicus]